MSTTIILEPGHQILRISCDACGKQRDISFIVRGADNKVEIELDINEPVEFDPSEPPEIYCEVVHVVK